MFSHPGRGLAEAGAGGKGVSDRFAAGESVVPVARRKVGERREAAKQPGPGRAMRRWGLAVSTAGIVREVTAWIPGFAQFASLVGRLRGWENLVDLLNRAYQRRDSNLRRVEHYFFSHAPFARRVPNIIDYALIFSIERLYWIYIVI